MSELTTTSRDADQFDWTGHRDRIVELAGRGFSQAYIAKAVGLHPNSVSRILRSEYQDRNANRQKIIEAHSQTVQWLKMKITERIADAGKVWDRRDGELLLKVLERESRLFGTDQPVQTQTQINVTIEDLSDDDIQKQLAAEGFVFTQLSPPQIPQRLPEHIEEAEVTSHVGTDEDDPTAPAEVGPDLC